MKYTDIDKRTVGVETPYGVFEVTFKGDHVQIDSRGISIGEKKYDLTECFFIDEVDNSLYYAGTGDHADAHARQIVQNIINTIFDDIEIGKFKQQQEFALCEHYEFFVILCDEKISNLKKDLQKVLLEKEKLTTKIEELKKKNGN